MPTSPFQGFFSRPSIGQPEVIDKGPDRAASFLSGFYARAGCSSVQAPCGSQGVKLSGREISSE